MSKKSWIGAFRRHSVQLGFGFGFVFLFGLFQNASLLSSSQVQFSTKINLNATAPTAPAYDTVYYWVQTEKINLCGSNYTEVTVHTDNPLVNIGHSSLGPDSKTSLAQLASHIVDARINPTNPVHLVLKGSANISSNTPLLLFQLSTAMTQDKDCAQVGAAYKSLSKIASLVNFETDLLSANVNAAGFQLQLAPHYYANSPGGFSVSNAQAIVHPALGANLSPATGPIQHLIIYSSPYQAQALRLAQFHNQHGLNSSTVLVDTLPGLGQNDYSIPADCASPYLEECFYIQDAQHITPMPGVAPGLVSGLFGLVPLSYIPVSGSFRVKDRAGLIRAALRKYLRENANLNYVVLMGDLQSLPMRYTDVNTLALGYSPDDNLNKSQKLPTDAYYREPITPWLDNGTREPSYVLSQDMLYPNRQPTDPGFSGPYDPTTFYWPIRLPHSRYLERPGTHQSRLLAVGRITGKIPGSDADVREVVNRTMNWNTHPLSTNSTIEANELLALNPDRGVAGTPTLEGYEQGYGSFKYFGAGFGAAYPTSASAFTSAGCTDLPATNDWHWFITGYNSTGHDRIGYYMANANSCWPTIQLSNGTFPLPTAASVADYAAAHGFGFMILDTHGGPGGTGFSPQTSGFNDTNNVSTSPQNAGVNQFTFTQPNQPNGFVVASSCEVSPIQGGAYWKWPSYYSSDTFGEYWLKTPGAGGVGVLMNYIEGASDGATAADEGFNIQFGAAVKTMQTYSAQNQHSKVRVGDALNLLFKQRLAASGYADFRSLNRVYSGDPAALLPGTYP